MNDTKKTIIRWSIFTEREREILGSALYGRAHSTNCKEIAELALSLQNYQDEIAERTSEIEMLTTLSAKDLLNETGLRKLILLKKEQAIHDNAQITSGN